MLLIHYSEKKNGVFRERAPPSGYERGGLDEPRPSSVKAWGLVARHPQERVRVENKCRERGASYLGARVVSLDSDLGAEAWGVLGIFVFSRLVLAQVTIFFIFAQGAI